MRDACGMDVCTNSWSGLPAPRRSNRSLVVRVPGGVRSALRTATDSGVRTLRLLTVARPCGVYVLHPEGLLRFAVDWAVLGSAQGSAYGHGSKLGSELGSARDVRLKMPVP